MCSFALVCVYASQEILNGDYSDEEEEEADLIKLLAVKYSKIDNRKNKLRNADVSVTEAKVRVMTSKKTCTGHVSETDDTNRTCATQSSTQ